MVYLPALYFLVIFKMAFPFLLVFTLYFLPLNLNVIFLFLRAFPFLLRSFAVNFIVLPFLTFMFLATIIVSIGITRIYLGVHYPTDVIAGFFVTIAIIIVNVKILDKVIVDTAQKDIIKEPAKDS
jgi:hypothetical protein